MSDLSRAVRRHRSSSQTPPLPPFSLSSVYPSNIPKRGWIPEEPHSRLQRTADSCDGHLSHVSHQFHHHPGRDPGTADRSSHHPAHRLRQPHREVYHRLLSPSQVPTNQLLLWALLHVHLSRLHDSRSPRSAGPLSGRLWRCNKEIRFNSW